jgi:hypothetical protein
MTGRRSVLCSLSTEPLPICQERVFLFDVGRSKNMTIVSVSVMTTITITTPRGVTIGSGFRTMGGGAS